GPPARLPDRALRRPAGLGPAGLVARTGRPRGHLRERPDRVLPRLVARHRAPRVLPPDVRRPVRRGTGRRRGEHAPGARERRRRHARATFLRLRRTPPAGPGAARRRNEPDPAPRAGSPATG